MVVGSRRNWFTIISFLGLFNRPRRTFISFYQKASVLWFAKYWQPIVVYTRQERGFSQNTSRNSGGCFHFLSVWIWCFFFIALENENSQLYVKGSAAVHWLQVWSAAWFMLVYFQFLLHYSYCFFGWSFGYTFCMVVAPLFSPSICWYFPPFFTFITGFIVSFLCFSSLYFSDILCWLFNYILLLFISLSSQHLLKYCARNCALIM